MLRFVLCVLLATSCGCLHAQTSQLPVPPEKQEIVVASSPVTPAQTPAQGDAALLAINKSVNEDSVLVGVPTPIRDRLRDARSNTRPSVLMLTRSGCAPCKLWARNSAPSWKKAGWDVQQSNYVGDLPTPWFVVSIEGKLYRVIGPLDTASLEKAKFRGPIEFSQLESETISR